MSADLLEPEFPPAHRGDAAMELLAACLADNYFDVTFGFPDKPGHFADNYRKVFASGESRDFVRAPRMRNVLLIGAGASFAAFGGELFPTAPSAIEELRKKLGVNGLRDALRLPDGGASNQQDRFEEEEAEFKQLHGIEDPRHDFESQLSILSKFYTPRQVRNALGIIYRNRYYPHLVFETMAHLLKHRFIDVAISYNFDEVLDQAIHEEVRGGDYERVISDGDLADFAHLVVDDTLKVPLYIKPHGTISHKSSLRFTKDAYIGMPSDLLDFTRKILLGHTQEDHEQQRENFRVNLISVGFAFGSVELIDMLRRHPRLRVFHINVEGGRNEALLAAQVRKIGPGVEQYLIGIRPPGSEVHPDVARTRGWESLNDVMADLFQRVHDRFKEPYKPRHLGRHHLVHHLLFKPYSAENRAAREEGAPVLPHGSGSRVPSDPKHYFLARLCVELAIALAKGNGRIDLQTLVKDRVGIYFRLLQRQEPQSGLSLRSICRHRLKLRDEQGFAGNLFTVDGWQPPAPDAQPTDTEVRWKVGAGAAELAERLWQALKGALIPIDDKEFRDHVAAWDHPDRRELLLRPLAQLIHSDIHELAPRFAPEELLLLNNPMRERVIHTPLGMTARFEELIEDWRWDLLLSVTEHGKVLGKLGPFRFRNLGTLAEDSLVVQRRASIVVADPPDHDQELLRARLQQYRTSGLLIGGDYLLPYWAHNDHMIITCRMGVHRGQFEPLGAISYRRPGLNNRVNPVFINDDEGLELLMRTYFGYVAKAEHYMDPRRGGVPDVDRERTDKTRERLLGQWWDRMMEERQARDTPDPSARAQAAAAGPAHDGRKARGNGRR